MERTSDSAVQVGASLREPGGFVRFYERTSPHLLRYFMRRVLDANTAFDLTAETFAQAYLSRGKFRGTSDAEASAWIHKIATRQFSRYVRKGVSERRALTKLGVQRPELDDEQEAQIERLAGLDAVRPVLRQELERLSPGYRAAVRLRVVEELPYPEVAKRLQISEQAARARVSRALNTLATALETTPSIKEAL